MTLGKKSRPACLIKNNKKGQKFLYGKKVLKFEHSEVFSEWKVGIVGTDIFNLADKVFY